MLKRPKTRPEAKIEWPQHVHLGRSLAVYFFTQKGGVVVVIVARVAHKSGRLWRGRWQPGAKATCGLRCNHRSCEPTGRFVAPLPSGAPEHPPLAGCLEPEKGKRSALTVMEWPQDILENIRSQVRRSVNSGLKRRQCDRLRDELMQKWFDVVFKPFVTEGRYELLDKHPEGNFMDDYIYVEFPLMFCLLAHWNINYRALRCVQDDLLEDVIFFLEEHETFYEDWEGVLSSHYPDEEWPNRIDDLKCVMSCP